ncbi:hypothetical protein BGX30_005476 [Mortierella sp. GBA39]|nr:hypothetical protein BGX30_005476 [Mortierella sp. GBA39]
MECGECKAVQERYCAKKALVYHDTFKDGCPAPSHGGFANRIRLCSKFLPPLFCAGLTTFTALRKYGAGADKMVRVKGIGALSHLAIQYAKAMGSKEIVAINDSDEVVLSLVSNHGTVAVLALSKVPMSIPTMPLTHRDIEIVLSFQGGRKDVKEMLPFTAKHEIHAWIVMVPFDKINDANEFKEKESNVEASKPGAEQYLKED